MKLDCRKILQKFCKPPCCCLWTSFCHKFFCTLCKYQWNKFFGNMSQACLYFSAFYFGQFHPTPFGAAELRSKTNLPPCRRSILKSAPDRVDCAALLRWNIKACVFISPLESFKQPAAPKTTQYVWKVKEWRESTSSFTQVKHKDVSGGLLTVAYVPAK